MTKKDFLKKLSKEIKSAILSVGLDSKVRVYNDISIEILVYGDSEKRDMISNIINSEIVPNYKYISKDKDLEYNWTYSSPNGYFGIYIV